MTAPIPSDQRAPNTVATQPISGAPMGVPPCSTTMYTASTRPRITGSVESWMLVLQAFMKVSEASPTGTSATA